MVFLDKGKLFLFFVKVAQNKGSSRLCHRTTAFKPALEGGKVHLFVFYFYGGKK
jgi:hypothetical protein